MGTRFGLHEGLKELLGSSHVYFQPPSTLTMKYPCIVYSRNEINKDCANDEPYRIIKRYRVTVIDANPDSDIPDKVLNLPKCTFASHFTKDNLNHDVFNLYY